MAGAVRQNLAMASSDPTDGGNGERDVFGSLPNSRPQRRSAKRDRAGATAKAAAPAPARAKATAAKPKSATPTAAKAKAKPKPRTAAKAGAGAKARPAATPGAAASQIPPAGYATPRAEDDGVPRGAHLVTTAVQAVGELAQIGLSAGGRALKSALERLPRP
jgi:hypothetical protein